MLARAPNLTSVQGSVFINSTAQLDCSKWQQLNASGVIKGTFFYASALSNSVSGGAGLSPGAIAGIVVGCVAALALFVVGCYFVTRSPDRNCRQVSEGPSASDAAVADSQHVIVSGVVELASNSNVPQLAGVLGPVQSELSGTERGEDFGRVPAQGELEGGSAARGSSLPAELSGWGLYEMHTGAERHEMAGSPRETRL
jgi:hypothetical protein